MKRQFTSRERIVAARSIVHKFLKRFPVWTKPQRVLMGLLSALRLASISLRFNSTQKLKKKNEKVILENCQSSQRRIISGPVDRSVKF